MALLQEAAFFVAVVAAVRGQLEDSYVECKSQQEACVCDENWTECRFRLKVEEIQTFTSYRYRGADSNGELLVRGFAGSTYYLNDTGIRPSLPTRYSYGPCWSDSVTSLADFVNDLNCSIPMMVDGRTYLTMIAVNDRVPGPTLVVTEGQRVVVDVHNRLSSAGVSIHWHGLHQHGTPWMDGVAFLSQAPIAPGSVFRYNFTASPIGTHWYHSHVGSQRVDGLFGGLVIREKAGTREEIRQKIGSQFEDIPQLHTITLSDLLRENSLGAYVKVKSILRFYSESGKPLENVPQQSDMFTPKLIATDGSSLGPIPYWSGLINGRGRYDKTTFSFLSVFEVDAGKAYRFRVVGAQGLYAFKLEVVRHKLKVISSDGHLLVPVEVDFLIVHTGESYDFILTADQAPENYLIRAQLLDITRHFDDSSGSEFVNYTVEAVLHYNDVSVPQPDPLTRYEDVIDTVRTCGPAQRCKALNCPYIEFPSEFYTDCISLNDLQSLFLSKEEDLPDLRTLLYDNSTVFLNFGFDGNLADPSVNGRTFQLPPTPYQTYPGQYEEDRQNYPMETCQYCHSVNASTENCDCTYVIPIAEGKRYDTDGNQGHVIMVFSAVTIERGQESHPIHLHGHSFYVVHIGHGRYENGVLTSLSEHIDCGDSRCTNPKWNGSVPDFSKYISDSGKLMNTAIRKDTIVVPAGGYVVIAVPLNNPGYWLLHCHTEPHLFKGMGVVIQEYPEDQHPPPPYGINKIGHFWGEEEQKPAATSEGRDRWMEVAIAALLLAAVALVIVVVQNVISRRGKNSNLGVCCSLKRRKNIVARYSVFNEQSLSDHEEIDITESSVD